MNTRFWILALSLLLLCSLLGGCAGENAAMDGAYDYPEKNETETVTGEAGDLSANLTDSALETTRKIIRRVEMEVQTKTYDALLTHIEEKLVVCGGYVESSRENNRDSRYAQLILRVPAEKLREFTDAVEEQGTVVSSRVGTEDVTLEYVDIESRIKALKAEQTSLLAMLEKADNLSDLLTIQSRITEVTAELESYESRLRTYDSLVAYSTITMDIYEVERVEQVEELSAWEQIGKNLTTNLEDIGNGFVAFFVFFVSALPYLLLLAIPVVIVVLLVRRSSRKRRQNLQNVTPYPSSGNPYDPPKSE